MSTILLIRHGESESNIGLATTDHKSVKLTELGANQAKRIARYLAEQLPPILIATSPYLRAKRTAALTEEILPNVRLEEWAVQEFTYLSSNDFPELSNAEDRKPLVDAYWEMCDPAFKDGPDTESFEQFIERVQKIIQRIKKISKKPDYKTIAIFSHEQFIRALQWISQGDITMHDFRNRLEREPLRNGAILRTEIDNNQERWDWETITFHLGVQESRPYAEARR